MVFIFTSGNQFRIVEMSSWFHSQIKPRVDANPLSSHTPLSHMVLIDNFRRISNSPPTTPPPLLSPPPSSPGGRISPAVLFIIVILAVIFFISGLLHLLVRFFTKHRSSSPSTGQSSRYYPDLSTPDTYQRQLQQLFNLHDSGLDQAFIDALPVFHYKEIVGLKEPFDCAVCLCEFSDKDKLRLLPLCSHAFHIGCIDTWLLSNSTCPLCRGALYSPGLAIENPVFDFDESREEENDGCGGGGGNGGNEVTAVFGQKSSSSETEVTGNQKRVFHVRLGKFRNTNDNNTAGVGEGGGDIEVAETSSRLDARRCFSMGSYQYVVAESELQVALCPKQKATNGGSGVELKGVKGKVGLWQNRNFTVDEDSEGKRIGNKNESFSVSKVWLWSNKRKFPSSSSSNVHLGSDDNSNTLSTDATTTLPWMKTTGGRP